MEFTVLSFIREGSFIAVAAFLLYIIKKQSDRIDKMEEENRSFYKELSNKIEMMESELVSKVDFYRDISAWREDIKKLTEKVDILTKEFAYFKGVYSRLKDYEGWSK